MEEKVDVEEDGRAVLIDVKSGGQPRPELFLKGSTA